MALNHDQKISIKETIKHSILHRFETYNPEPAAMPFHIALLGKDRLALYAFVHSLNTSFGTNIFEPVAIEVAKTKFAIAKHQVQSGSTISSKAQEVIQIIMNNLSTATTHPNKGGFMEFKLTLLVWAATVLYENPQAQVHTVIAIPYNPYAPNPYNR